MTRFKPEEILIISDMDGTLITAPERVPGKSCAAIERFISAGGRFAVATGRAVESIRHYKQGFSINAPAIAFNGAVLYDYEKNSVVWCDPLPKSAGDIIRKVRARYPEVGVELHLAEKLFSLHFDRFLQRRQDREAMVYTHITDPDEAVGDWCKFLFATGPELQPEVLNYIGQIASNDVYFVPTNENFIEVVEHGVNKGAALVKLRAIMGEKTKFVVAAGDYYNDVDLLKDADFKAVPSTAPADIRAMADLIIPPPEEGGISALVEYVFEHLCN